MNNCVFVIISFQPPKKGKEKGKAAKKPAKTDKQKKAEAEMMRKVIAQYVSQTVLIN